MKAILRKGNCLEAIEEKPEGITNKKWKEIDNNAIANLHLALKIRFYPALRRRL